MPNTVTDEVLTSFAGLTRHLESLLPWVKQLNATEQAELLADLAHAWPRVRQTGHVQALTEVLEDWEATAMVLSDAALTARLLAPEAPEDYTPWEEIRDSLSGDAAS